MRAGYLVLTYVLAVPGCAYVDPGTAAYDDGNCPALSDAELQEVSSDYKNNHTYESMRILACHLKLRMSRTEVEGLLGNDYYSPSDDGLNYYSSDAAEISEESGLRTPLGMIVSYRQRMRDPKTELIDYVETAELQGVWIGPIAE